MREFKKGTVDDMAHIDFFSDLLPLLKHRYGDEVGIEARESNAIPQAATADLQGPVIEAVPTLKDGSADLASR